jgi:hypothetical protein
MTLQKENRIRGTTEMGAGLRTTSLACVGAGQPCRRADAAVQIRVVAAVWGLGRACRGRPHLILIGDAESRRHFG